VAVDDTAVLELCALEGMIKARCEQIWRFAQKSCSHGPASREREFQLEAFVERSTNALEQLESGLDEPSDIRIARLEALLQALECSWAYFSAENDGPITPQGVCRPAWSVLVR
jgi:transcriptional regulator with XRE-family HTH domain